MGSRCIACLVLSSGDAWLDLMAPFFGLRAQVEPAGIPTEVSRLVEAPVPRA